MNLYQSEYCHRGYIYSLQEDIFIMDIDFFSRIPFKLEMVGKDIRIHPIDSYQIHMSAYQEYIDIIFLNFDKNILKNFRILNKEKKILDLEKNIENNKIRFYIPKDFIKENDNHYLLDHPDLTTNIKIIISNDISKKICIEQGEDKIINEIKSFLRSNKMIANLYKTQNGLRIIFLDKIRNIFDSSNYNEMEYLNKMLYGDYLYLNYSLNVRKSYTMRITPKLRNFEKISLEDYKKYENDMRNHLGINYVKDSKNQKNGNIIINKLKDIYFNSKGFSVTRILDRVGEIKNKNFEDFIKYHDLWTKADQINSILV